MHPDVHLVASGDSRPAANRQCWPAQQALEATIERVLGEFGRRVVRGHPVDPLAGHGFIDGQARGIQVFRDIDPRVPLIVATAVWQYTSHVLPGLIRHRGPILTLANWSGQWPGLVGLLNVNASLTKAGVAYSTIWSEDFEDAFSREAIRSWLEAGHIEHDLSHVRSLDRAAWSGTDRAADERGAALGGQLRDEQAILGIFDEGCMGMYNAIIPDDLLHRLGIFKERLSQSALYAAMLEVPEATAREHYEWLLGRGMQFTFGPDPTVDLTESQVLEGLKMYDAAVQFADRFGCAAIGIQYQQGLKDVCVASDLAEGLLNNPDRPPVRAGGRVLFEGLAVPHFNEVDEPAGLDAIITNRVWRALGLDPSTTLHDVRWGERIRRHGLDDFVWVLEISGAVPASHLVDGYAGARGERQPAMYFPRGGATLKGISRPGEIVWSRIYVEAGSLFMDIGRGGVAWLPAEEHDRRWKLTTEQWPMMDALFYGVTRDQFMAKHKANHVEVVYAPDPAVARQALVMKAAMAAELGIQVNLCGNLEDSLDNHQVLRAEHGKSAFNPVGGWS